jgi:hypothetical protein
VNCQFDHIYNREMLVRANQWHLGYNNLFEAKARLRYLYKNRLWFPPIPRWNFCSLSCKQTTFNPIEESYDTEMSTVTLTSTRLSPSALHLVKSLSTPTASHSIRQAGFIVASQKQNCRPSLQVRCFSVTPASRMKEFFPKPDSPHIAKTEAAWSHPM